MVLKLYGHILSTCTRRVTVVLHEKKVPFEFIQVKFTLEEKPKEMLATQPFGQVPYIDDDGFVLYESRAIAWYIATKYAAQGTRLIPEDVQAQARLFQAWSVETSYFVHAEEAVAATVFRKFRGLEVDTVALEKHLTALDKALTVYEDILSKQKYVAGDELPIADLFHLPYAYALPLTGTDLISKKPNVKRWYEDVSSRAAWQTVKDEVKPFP